MQFFDEDLVMKERRNDFCMHARLLDSPVMYEPEAIFIGESRCDSFAL